MSPLLRELILQAVADAPLWLTEPRHARLIGVLLDHLDVVDTVGLQLPMPHDPRACSVADAVLADPASGVTIADLARAAGASTRTIERLFRAQTAMTVQRWRARARLLVGLRELAGGASVTAAAIRSGYSTPSSFGAAFRQELGVSPRQYFASRTGTASTGRPPLP